MTEEFGLISGQAGGASHPQLDTGSLWRILSNDREMLANGSKASSTLKCSMGAPLLVPLPLVEPLVGLELPVFWVPSQSG